MKPTSAQLLALIRSNLTERVLPEVSSEWAASTLRSVDGLLAHLAVRVEREGELLAEDIRDARATIAEVGSVLDACGRTVPAELRAAAVAPSAEGYVSTTRLAEENADQLALIDFLLATTRKIDLPAQHADTVDSALRAYLRRHVDRRAELFGPAASLPPF